METREAIKIMDAICTLADVLAMSEQEVCSNVCFLNKERYAKLVEANKIYNDFQDKSVADRGRALGYEVVESPVGISISTTL